MKNYNFEALSPTDVQEIQTLAQQGNPRFQYAWGLMLEQGNAVQPNRSLAFEWYHQAAQQGFAPAQNNMGLLYEQTRQFDQAFYWYQQAASQGFPPAQENLGALYQNGQGSPVDVEQAIFWYQHAFTNGAQHLAPVLAYLYHQELPQPNLVQALQWYVQAASLGDVRSAYNIALIYYQGESSVTAHPVIAYAILRYLLIRQTNESIPELAEKINPKLQQLAHYLDAEAQQIAEAWVQAIPSTAPEFLEHLDRLLRLIPYEQ